MVISGIRQEPSCHRNFIHFYINHTCILNQLDIDSVAINSNLHQVLMDFIKRARAKE